MDLNNMHRFVTINVKNINGQTVLPVAGSSLAAGYDLIAMDDPLVVGTQLPPSFKEDGWWKTIDYLEYHTGLFIAPQTKGVETYHPDHYHTLLHPRSSVRKYNLVLANSIGLVDNDYRGEIILCFKYLWQPEDLIWGQVKDHSDPKAKYIPMMLGRVNQDKIYKKGDKIGQLVAELTNLINFRLVSELDETARGEGGFGSTDVASSVQSASWTSGYTSANTDSISTENVQPTKQPSPPTMGTTGITERSSLDEPPRVKKLTEFDLPPSPPKSQAGKPSPIIEAYNKAGGIPIRKRYSEEMKDKAKGI